MGQDLENLKGEAVKNLFKERKDFIIIGLTGRTGSGCSKIAELLSKSFQDLQPPIPIKNGNINDRQYEVVYNYAEKSWEKFKVIEMKNIIFTFLLEKSFDELVQNLHKQGVNIDCNGQPFL